MEILFFIGLFIVVYLWVQIGKFVILLVSNDLSWKHFKEDWKEESEGFEEVLYLCWVIVLPLLIYYRIKENYIK
jgi:ABC-type uncharacterized transport system permease subunit